MFSRNSIHAQAFLPYRASKAARSTHMAYRWRSCTYSSAISFFPWQASIQYNMQDACLPTRTTIVAIYTSVFGLVLQRWGNDAAHAAHIEVLPRWLQTLVGDQQNGPEGKRRWRSDPRRAVGHPALPRCALPGKRLTRALLGPWITFHPPN